MTPGLTCHACHRPFAGRLAHRTDDGFRHVICQRIPPRRRHVLPLEPLLPYLDRIAKMPRKSALRDAVDKAVRRGQITFITADRAAIALGYHPALIWGDDWWAPVEDGEAA